MDRTDDQMTLAEIVHRAVTDPAFRLALETRATDSASTAATAQLRASPLDLDAVSEVLRRWRGSTAKKVLPEIVAWRDDT